MTACFPLYFFLCYKSRLTPAGIQFNMLAAEDRRKKYRKGLSKEKICFDGKSGKIPKEFIWQEYQKPNKRFF